MNRIGRRTILAMLLIVALPTILNLLAAGKAPVSREIYF
jgi:hypothetical protein